MHLKGKHIVITGGTSGIGFELVKQLNVDNEIIVISRSQEKLNKLKDEFDVVHCYQADLSELEQVESTANLLAKKFGSIDILINNAAVQNTPSFLSDDFCYKSIASEVTLNFTSICCFTYLLLPSLRHDNQAVILNINSGLGLVPKTSSAIYCGTKGALNLFSQSLGYQLEDTNISVQQAFLPLVETGMTRGRGSNKLAAEDAARRIIHGIEKNIIENDIGKVKLLRKLFRIFPSKAKQLLKNS